MRGLVALGAAALALCGKSVLALTGDQIDALVNGHNTVRADASSNNPPPLNALPPLSWSDSVASSAQNYASSCPYSGGTFHHSGTSGVGENLFWGSTGFYKAADAVNSWASEKQYFNPTTTIGGYGNDFGKVGHYTQMIWETTTQVGCGVATCSGWDFWVCQYSPPGNWVDKTPYTIGSGQSAPAPPPPTPPPPPQTPPPAPPAVQTSPSPGSPPTSPPASPDACPDDTAAPPPSPTAPAPAGSTCTDNGTGTGPTNAAAPQAATAPVSTPTPGPSLGSGGGVSSANPNTASLGTKSASQSLAGPGPTGTGTGGARSTTAPAAPKSDATAVSQAAATSGGRRGAGRGVYWEGMVALALAGLLAVLP
ncbi:PR-1-like protein [Gonapodya prolifera JEL478]|uniref:PR-1-like protein n=1 Tax=Gonapodya prolifera (strain JEL478) TaxID=1344416 RepID=A0A139A940_GONPJ|nr:PR-1-like protein [Gonapodya prolifera JEL478]|eukprot:KXS13276.1 PR-1-like protein [Gonapodya prolifera JEL478]